jgi:hypothetical protein
VRNSCDLPVRSMNGKELNNSGSVPNRSAMVPNNSGSAVRNWNAAVENNCGLVARNTKAVPDSNYLHDCRMTECWNMPDDYSRTARWSELAADTSGSRFRWSSHHSSTRGYHSTAKRTADCRC